MLHRRRPRLGRSVLPFTIFYVGFLAMLSRCCRQDFTLFSTDSSSNARMRLRAHLIVVVDTEKYHEEDCKT